MEIRLAEINDIFRELRGAVPDKNAANSFLKNLAICKNNVLRFICWMLEFDLIPENEEWRASQLYKYYLEYTELIKNYEIDKKDPLILLNQKAAYVIKADIDRSIYQFNCFAKNLGIDKRYIQIAKECATRIIVLLTLEEPGFVYTQSYDRFIFVCYLLSIVFASSYGLPPMFAESCTFYLAPCFINTAAANTFLNNPSETEQYFKEIDKRVEKVCPKIAKQLKMHNCGSIHYALHWELVMFADEYDIESLLLLWDQIVSEKKHYQQYIDALCISHVKQVPIARKNEVMVEKIQTYKNWNVVKVITTARDIISSERKNTSSLVYLFIVLALFIIYVSLKKN